MRYHSHRYFGILYKKFIDDDHAIIQAIGLWKLLSKKL